MDIFEIVDNAASPVSDPLQVIIVGVLREPSVEESPREVVDRVLFVLYGLRNYLCVQVIV